MDVEEVDLLYTYEWGKLMSKKLSQNEIDALIQAMLTEEESPEGAAPHDAAPPDTQMTTVDASMMAGLPSPDASASVDLGPISQEEVNALLRAAGRASLIPQPPRLGLGIAAPTPKAAAPAPLAPAPEAPPVPAPAPSRLAAMLSGPAADILLDLELTLTAELVRTRMRLSQLLALQPGSVLELERRANEPVDIIINGTQLMKAKVVTIGENYGVQVTETRLRRSVAS